MVKLKKLFGSSAYTLKANIWTQFSGVIIMLSIPNLLSIEDYAKIIYFTFLLSFVSLYDFGLVSVYNRLMPGLVTKSSKKVQEIESTLIRYLIVMSIMFSLVISFFYYIKYNNIFESCLIVVFVPISLIVGFLIVRDVVREDYKVYYKNIRFQSIIKLIQLPLVFVFSIVGWFISSLITNLILFIKVFKNNIFINTSNYSFIKDNLREGIELSIKTFVWIQVLNFPRTYASINYSDELIAQYGLVNSIYQVVVSLSIAIFVPVTIKTFKLFSKSDRLAFYYLKKVLKNTIPLFFLGTILLIIIVPEVIAIAFPKYNIPFDMILGYFGAVILFPLFFIIGNIFTVKKDNKIYIFILLISYSISYIFAECIIGLNYAFLLLILFCTVISSFYIYVRNINQF